MYNGDVLVTKTKGHTVIVVSGRERDDDNEKAKTTKTASKKTSSSSNSDFVKDVQKAIGAKVDGIAGPETINKTITVSRTNNRSHAVVKVIQKQLNKLGYSCGTADGIAGIKFDRAVKRYQKDKGCVVDGVLTAGGKTWKKLLGM